MLTETAFLLAFPSEGALCAGVQWTPRTVAPAGRRMRWQDDRISFAFPAGEGGPLQRWMRFTNGALASTIILPEPTQAGETYQKIVAYDEQSAENFEKVCYNYHGILCGIWRKGG